MVAAQVTVTPPLFSQPYITVAEYNQAPTGVDLSNLVSKDPAASAAEGANIIARASAWADNFCGQILAATTDTDTNRVQVSRDGYMHIHPRYTPILEVTDFRFGTAPNNLQAMTDLSGIGFYGQEFHVPSGVASFSSFTGPLQFGSAGYNAKYWVQYSYINGYPNTLLATAPGAAGATTLTVTDATGIIGGLTQLGIYDGAQAELVKVASVAGNVLTLTAPTVFAHTQTGVSVSALPPSVKQAVILLTTALVKTRGTSAIVAPGIRSQSAGQRLTTEAIQGEDVDYAYDLLMPYRRVR